MLFERRLEAMDGEGEVVGGVEISIAIVAM